MTLGSTLANLDNHSVVVIPKHNNERLIRQSGAFLIFGIQQKKEECASINKFSLRLKHKSIHLLVLEEDKGGIKEELEQVNVHEGTLFPELDRVAFYLKNIKYKI